LQRESRAERNASRLNNHARRQRVEKAAVPALWLCCRRFWEAFDEQFKCGGAPIVRVHVNDGVFVGGGEAAASGIERGIFARVRRLRCWCCGGEKIA
jgi:hypothetical protein